MELQSTKPNISIVIPAYNEALGIVAVLQQIFDVVDKMAQTFEILVVDDGSHDNTAQLAQEAGATVIQHPYNIGNGAAVKAGIRAAQGEFVLLMDADGQHKPEDIPRLIEQTEKYDMVVGARAQGSETAVHRDIANFIYNRFASYVCDRKIEDLTSGFRVIRADIAKSFVYMLPNTFSYPTTITLAVIRSGYNLKYVPIVAPKRVGKSKIKLLRDGSRFFMILFKIATLFSPLKIFVPASIFTFLLGLGYGAYKVIFLNTRYGPTSAMLMTIAGLIFLIGLVSEQITYLRYDKSQ